MDNKQKIIANSHDSIMKACYAWHDDIDAPFRHSYIGQLRCSICEICGRTREQVRYDSLPETCQILIYQTTNVHRFGGSAPWTKCIYCDQPRDKLNDTIQLEKAGGYGFKVCPRYRPIDTSQTLLNEEEKYNKLLERANREIPRLINKLKLSGETISILHHTYGYDVETISDIIEIPDSIMSEYYDFMEIERDRSRNSTVRDIILIKHITP